MSIQKITRVAFLSATLYLAKISFSFLPNVELVSFFIILFTLIFGKETLLTIMVFNMFELIQWGPGSWWFSYLYTWPCLCLIVLWLKRLFAEDFFLWSIVSGTFGLLFGSFFALFYIPVSPTYALSYWISGLPWDVWHAICNFLIMLTIGKPIYRVLKRFKHQLP